MSQSNQTAISKEFSQAVKQLFDDLYNKTTDMAANNSISNQGIKLQIKLPNLPTLKPFQLTYQKILNNLATYQLKTLGSKMEPQTFSNLVNKKNKMPIRNYMIKQLKLEEQTANFLAEELVIGVQCKQTIKYVGAQILKMEKPFANECKLFVERIKRSIEQQQKITNSIADLDKTLNETYFSYRSNWQKNTTRHKEPTKAITALSTEVKYRSEMMAKFFGEFENDNFIQNKMKHTNTFSAKLKEIINAIKSIQDEMRKLQKVNSSYQQLMFLEQKHVQGVNKVKIHNDKKKNIVLQSALQQTLSQFVSKIQKHFNEKSNLQQVRVKYLQMIKEKESSAAQHTGRTIQYQQKNKQTAEEIPAKNTSSSLLDKLKLQNKTLGIKNKQTQYANSILRQQNSKLSEQLEVLKQQTDRFHEQKHRLSSQNQLLRVQVDTYSCTVKQFQSLKSQNEKEQKSLLSALQNLSSPHQYKLHKAQSEHLQLMQYLKSQNYRLNSQLQQMQIKYKTLISQKQNQKIQIDSTNNITTQQTNQQEQPYKNTQCCIATEQNFKDSLQLKEAQIKTIHQTLNDLHEEYQRNQRLHQQAQAQANQLQVNYEDKARQLRESQSKLRQKDEQTKNLRQTLQFLRKQHQQKVNDCTLITQLRAKEQTVSQLIQQNQKLNQDIIRLRKELDARSNILQEQEKQSQEKLDQTDDFARQLASIKKEKETAQIQLHQAKTRIGELQRDLQAEKTKDVLSKLMQDESNSQINLLNLKIADRDSEIAKQEQTITKNQQEIAAKQLEITKAHQTLYRVEVEWKAKLQQKQDLIKQLRATLAAQKQKKTEQEAQIERLMNQLQETTDYKSRQIDELKQQIQRQQTFNDNIKEQMDIKEEQLTKIKLKTDKVQRQLQCEKQKALKFQQKVKDLSKEKKILQTQLSKQLEQIKNIEGRSTQSSSQIDRLPKDIHLYYQQAAEKLQTGMLSLILTDRLLRGEMIKREVQHKHFIVSQLQKFQGRQIKQTNLIYKFDRNLYKMQCDQKHRAKVNFHDYIDGTHHMLVVVKSIKGYFLAGYNSGEYSNKGQMAGKGLIISLMKNEVFELHQQSATRKIASRAMLYDDYNINFGNSEIRMKWTDPNKQELFSNFGVSNAYYNHRGFKVDCLLGEGDNRDTSFQDFQIYEVQYDGEQQNEVERIPEVVTSSRIK